MFWYIYCQKKKLWLWGLEQLYN